MTAAVVLAEQPDLHHVQVLLQTDQPGAADYPEVAEEVATRVVAGEFDRGLLICGTGQGMAMAANKVKGARAALCYEELFENVF